MKILITGGSGFVGSKLSESFAKEGHEVIIVDHTPPRRKIANITFVMAELMNNQVPSEVLNCDAVVHLAGANIFSRWTKKYKKLILESRTKTARYLFDAFEKSGHKPNVFVSASAIGFYGDRGEEVLEEATTPGNDFLAEVCVAWERSAAMFEELGIRHVSVRTAIVLGPGGGMLSKLVTPFRWFLGGRMGSGRQWFSWIHIDDLIKIYMAAVVDSRLWGPINASAPEAIRNIDFVKSLGNVLRRPAWIPLPAVVLRLALGEFAEAILGSERVVPKKLEHIDFQFTYPTIDSALAACFKE